MGFSNALMVELMVPRTPEVAQRLHGFFEALGWKVRPETDEPPFVYVQPPIERASTLSYWHTENPRKIACFEDNNSTTPSIYSRGLRLPKLNDLVEICLIAPNDEAVNNLWKLGAALLEAHAHTPKNSCRCR